MAGVVSAQTWAFLNSYLTSVAPIYAKGYVETQFKKHVFLSRLMKQNRVQTYQEGGQGIIKRIAYGTNPTIKLRGPKSDPPLQFNEFMTQAFWPWGSITGSLTFWDDDIKKCRGKQQLVAWVEPQVQQAMKTVDKQLSWWVLQGNTGRTDDTTKFDTTSDTTVNNILGVRDGIAPGDGNTSLTPGSYGNIALADLGPNGILNDWYANVMDASANGGPGRLPRLLLQSIQSCVHGSEPIDFVCTDLNGWVLYADMAYPNVELTSFEGAGDTVFDAYSIGGKPLVWDVDCTPFLSGQDTGGGSWTGTADTSSSYSRYYGVPTGAFTWWWNPDWNYDNAIETDWRLPERGFRRSKLINLQCQLTLEDRRSAFLLYNVKSS